MKTSLQAPFSSYKIRKLGINEKVKSFDCGDADLNDFILNASTLYREALLAVTYVFEAEDDTTHEHIAAYFSLANDRGQCRISRIKLNLTVSASIVLSTRRG